MIDEKDEAPKNENDECISPFKVEDDVIYKWKE